MNNLLEIGYFKKCAKNGHSDTLAPLQQLVWYYYQTYVRSFCKKTHLSLSKDPTDRDRYTFTLLQQQTWIPRVYKGTIYH